MRSTTLPLFAFLLSSALASSDSTTEHAERDSEPLQETVYRRADGSVNIDFLASQTKQITAKYTTGRQALAANVAAGQAAAIAAVNAVVSTPSKRDGFEQVNKDVQKRSNQVVAVSDYYVGVTDDFYYTTLYVGSSFQALNFQIDTGSSDIWMPVKQISGMPSYLNTAPDKTYVNTGNSFTISYVSGNVAGTIATDTMGVTARSSRTSSQAFGAVTQVSSNFLNTPSNGILGIGFASLARTGKPTYIDNLYSQGLISAKIFGLYLSAGNKNPSSFAIGTTDTTKYTGSIIYTPVISQTYWEVSATGLYVGNTLATSSFRAAIDSGTTFIYVPTSVASAFFAQFPAAMAAPEYSSGNGAVYYKFPCSTTSSPAFRFAGQRLSYPIPITAFSIGTVQSPPGYCLSTVIGLNVNDATGQPMAIVGAAFMKNYYSVFNYNAPSGTPAVGFATLTT